MNNNSWSNETDECFALESVPKGIIAYHTTVLAVIVLASLLANGLVLLLVGRYKKLRCRSVVVSMSVVVVDLLITVVYVMPALVTAARRDWPFREEGCTAFGMLSFEFLITRWLIMALLCIDRFNAVRFAFKYRKYNKYILLSLTIIAWSVPFFVSLPALTDLATPILRENQPTCLLSCLEQQFCRLFYTGVITLSFMVGGVLPIVLYAWLYWKGRKARSSTHVLGKISVQVASGAIISRRMSENNMAHHSREARALFTFFLIFLTFFVTGMPAYLFQLIRSFLPQFHCKIPIIVHFLIIQLFMSSSALDPLVIMRDRDFRYCIKYLFCCTARTGDSSVTDYSPSRRTSNVMELNGEVPHSNSIPNGVLHTVKTVISIDTTVV